MEKRYKEKNLYRYFMMRGKTLAVLGALGVLGVAIYSQGAPTIGQLAQSMKSQPTSWTVVVGANANAADVVGASNIIAALETFTVPSTQNVTVSVSSTSTSQVPSGVYPFYSSQAPLYLGSNISSVYPVLQVGSGSFQISGQSYTYEAYVQPASDQITFNNFGSGSNYIPSVGVVSSNGQLLNLTIYFSPAINVTSLTTSPQEITVLGTSYYLSYNSNNGYMYLVPAANTLTLNVGQSTTVDGLTIQLANVVKNQQGTWYAVLNINGQQYTIQVGTSQVIDGVNVYVANAFASVLTSSSVSAGYATIVVSQGGYQFSLSSSSTGASVYTSSGTAVNGVTVTTNYNSTTQTLSELQFTFSLTSTQPNGQYALLAGQSYQLPIFSGYELYVAPVQLPTGPLALQLTPSGSSQYTLQYVDAVTGNTVSIPLYVSSSGALQLLTTSSPGFVGTITNSQSAVPGASQLTSVNVSQGGYFAVVDADLQQTYIFQVQSISTTTSGASATLYNYVTGQTITIYSGVPFTVGSITLTPAISSSGVTLSGSGLYYSNTGLTLYEGYDNYVSLSYSTSSPGTLNVTFAKNYEPTGWSNEIIEIPYNTSGFSSSISIVQPTLTGYSVGGSLLGNVSISSAGTATLNETLSGSPSNVTATVYVNGSSTSSGTLQGSITETPVITPEQVSLVTTGSNTYAYLDKNGVYLVETTSSSSNPTVQLYAPSQPLTFNVGLAPSGYTPSTTSTSTTQTVTVSVPTPTSLIGKVILDTQVTPSMSDLILVGGPAVNTLTAQAVIQYVSSMNATLGQELQSYANSQNGYIYGSELAPVLQQLGIPFGPGMALIMSSTLYPNTLVIFGWYGNDTTQATELFANYLVNNVDASVFNNATVVEVNDQQTVNGYPAATQIQ
ncbi:hypothetical protein Nps_00760 [Candidatus Nanopusillus acidilobi]|nr:hypothetical protein Nps_00760 [Candidatus Nanopusillus acidilobi]